MLRVTEEKERNFEKRGYMGKKVLGVLTILLLLSGCQNMGNEAENLQQVKIVQTETNPLRTLLFNQKGYVLTAAKLTQFLVSK